VKVITYYALNRALFSIKASAFSINATGMGNGHISNKFQIQRCNLKTLDLEYIS